MVDLAVWECKIGSVTTPVFVVAPANASLDSIATTAHLAHLDVNVNWAEGTVGVDVERERDRAARREVSAVVRCQGVYVAHPELGGGPDA